KKEIVFFPDKKEILFFPFVKRYVGPRGAGHRARQDWSDRMDDGTTMRLRNSGSGRLSAEEAAKLPDRLLDAATALFLEHGYGGVSMEGIARAAGASTKTLYGRYRNKDEILSAAIQRMVDRNIPTRIEEFETDPDTADAHALLVAIGRKLANLVMDKYAL